MLFVQPVAERGGSDHALLRMVRALSAAGWTCHVVFPGPSPMEEEFAAAGAIQHVVPMRRLTSSGGPTRWLLYAGAWPLSVGRLAVLARRTGAAVVHSNSLHSWYGWAAALLARRPHIWHAREIVVQSSAALAVERYLARRFAVVVVAISAAVAAQLSAGNVRIIMDEADPDEFSPQRAGAFRAREGIADDVPARRGGQPDRHLERPRRPPPVGAVAAAPPDPKLVIVVAGDVVAGKERYAAGLARQAEGMAGVRWLGPRRDIPELMADLDVAVQASTEPEPFGLVIVEALTSGTPVVATAAGGPLEILGAAASTAGRLVTPGDEHELAQAILSILPPRPSSSEQRRHRPRLRTAPPPPWPALFAEVADGALLRPPRRQIRASSS